MPKVTPVPAPLPAITDAAERCIPFAQIGAAIGLSHSKWQELVLSNPEAVALAVEKGRLRARINNGEALLRCAELGKVAAAVTYLKRYGGWR